MTPRRPFEVSVVCTLDCQFFFCVHFAEMAIILPRSLSDRCTSEIGCPKCTHPLVAYLKCTHLICTYLKCTYLMCFFLKCTYPLCSFLKCTYLITAPPLINPDGRVYVCNICPRYTRSIGHGGIRCFLAGPGRRCGISRVAPGCDRRHTRRL